MRTTHFLSLLFLLTTACSHGYRADLLPTPNPALQEALDQSCEEAPFTVGECLPDDWWYLFKDEQLADFIETALEHNPTLHKAHANILMAYYAANRVRSGLFPHLNWGGDVSRQKLSETGLIPFNPNPPQGSAPFAVPGDSLLIPVYFTQYETELNLVWDFDVWGKTRNTLCAALGEMQARIADEAFARLQLAVAVASAYYQLQIDYLRHEIAQAYVDNQSQTATLLSERERGHVDNNLPYQNAQAALSSARQSILQIEGDTAIHETALRAYLAGDLRESITPLKIAAQPLPRVPIPCDLPMHLLAHRPDITAQLWLIESAGKLVEVAQAGFYPDFNLAAFFGYQTLTLSKLFQWPSSFFNVDPAFSLPIFQGGRLIADLRGSEVNYNLAVYDYNALVLKAAQEVLDGITSLRTTAAQLQEAEQRVQHETERYNLTKLRLENGIVSALDLLAVEQSLLVARDQEAVLLRSTIQSMLALVKALGGGYETCYVDEAAANET